MHILTLRHDIGNVPGDTNEMYVGAGKRKYGHISTHIPILECVLFFQYKQQHGCCIVCDPSIYIMYG